MTKLDDTATTPVALRLWERRTTFGPFAVLGALGVVGGGVLAAAIAIPAPTRHGIWAVAYLVLVLGVGQLVLGAGQALLPATPPSARLVAVSAAVFNVGNAAILTGIITDRTIVFDVGSVLLIVALALFLTGVRRSDRGGWLLHAYRLFIAVLLVSIPTGMFLTTVGPH